MVKAMENRKLSDSFRSHRWAWIAGGVLAFIIILGLIAPLFIHVDKYRSKITEAISNATGRPVTLGTIHARLLPTAAAIVDGLQMGNPKDFAPGELLSVDQIRGKLTLLSLLRGEVHVTSVALVRPKLVLMQDENGQTNYTFPSQTTPQAGGTMGSSAETESRGGFSLSEIDEISLEDADVSLEQIHAQGAKPFPVITAQNINVQMGNVLLDAAAVKQWRANANLGGVSVTMGALAVPATFDSGQVTLAGGVLDANFSVSAGKIANVKGTIHVPDVTNAVTTFDISAPTLDANALLAAIRQTPETHASGTASSASAPPSELVAQGKLSADRVSWSPYAGEKASAEIRIYTDHMDVTPASMTLYGGTLQLSAHTDTRQNPERFSVSLELNGLNLGSMLDAAGPGMKGKMTGTAQLDLQLAGPGAGEWQKSLTGNGKFSIRDGKLPGVNLGGAMGMLAKASGVGETTFTSIGGDLTVLDGRVSTKQTNMDSSSGTLELAGSFSLIDQSMSFNGKATLAPSGGAIGVISGLLTAASDKKVNGITVPFSLSGTISNPRFAPGVPVPGSTSPSAAPKADAVQNGVQKLLGKHH
jgi:uncharacterized protein involved in outer membrane biogenesis